MRTTNRGSSTLILDFLRALVPLCEDYWLTEPTLHPCVLCELCEKSSTRSFATNFPVFSRPQLFPFAAFFIRWTTSSRRNTGITSGVVLGTVRTSRKKRGLGIYRLDPAAGGMPDLSLCSDTETGQKGPENLGAFYRIEALDIPHPPWIRWLLLNRRTLC